MSEINYKSLIADLVNNLISAGFNIELSNISIINLTESRDFCGSVIFVDENKYKLTINRKLLKENKLNYLKCVLYHELAHIIQYNEAVARGLIRYNKEGNYIDIICEDSDLVDSLVFDNFHHTNFWQEIVDKINSLYNPIPKVVAYLAPVDLDKFLEGFFMDKRKRPNDPVVDYTISGLTLDDMMKYDVKPEYRITMDDLYRDARNSKKENQPEVKEEKK